MPKGHAWTALWSLVPTLASTGAARAEDDDDEQRRIRLTNVTGVRGTLPNVV